MSRAGERVKQLEETLKTIEAKKKNQHIKCAGKDCEHIKCPKGKIERVAYNRKAYTKATGTKVAKTHVDAACIQNRGKPGKATKSSEIIVMKDEGMLEFLGYHTTLPELQRHQLIGKAIKMHGAMEVKQHLNARANQLIRTAPKASAVMRMDYEWIMSAYMDDGSKKPKSSTQKNQKNQKSQKGGAESEGATFIHPTFFHATSPSNNMLTTTAGFGTSPLSYTQSGTTVGAPEGLSYAERLAPFQGTLSASREINASQLGGKRRHNRRQSH